MHFNFKNIYIYLYIYIYALSQPLSLSHRVSLSQPLTHTQSLSLSASHSHTVSLSQPLTLTQSLSASLCPLTHESLSHSASPFNFCLPLSFLFFFNLSLCQPLSSSLLTHYYLCLSPQININLDVLNLTAVSSWSTAAQWLRKWKNTEMLAHLFLQ